MLLFSRVVFMALRQVDQDLAPGSIWFGQCNVDVIADNRWPNFIAGIIDFPSPVMMSPTVRTFRYFLQLLILIRSFRLNGPLRKSSIKNLSLFVVNSSGGEWSCMIM